MITIREAMRLTNKSESTIRRLIRKALSDTKTRDFIARNEVGHWLIDQALVEKEFGQSVGHSHMASQDGWLTDQVEKLQDMNLRLIEMNTKLVEMVNDRNSELADIRDSNLKLKVALVKYKKVLEKGRKGA